MAVLHVPAAASVVPPRAALPSPAAVREEARYLEPAASVLARLAGDTSVSLEARVQQAMEKLVNALVQHTQQRATAGGSGDSTSGTAHALVGAMRAAASDFQARAAQYFLQGASTVVLPTPEPGAGSGACGPSDALAVVRDDAGTQALLATWAAQEAEAEANVLAQFAPALQVGPAVQGALDTLLFATDDVNDVLRAARVVVEDSIVVGEAAVRATRERAFGGVAHLGDARMLLRGVADPSQVAGVPTAGAKLPAHRARATFRPLPSIPEALAGAGTGAGAGAGAVGRSVDGDRSLHGLSMSTIDVSKGLSQDNLPSFSDVSNGSFVFTQSQGASQGAGGVSASASASASASQGDSLEMSQSPEASGLVQSPRVVPTGRRSGRSGVRTPGSVMGTRKQRTKAVPPTPRTPLAVLATVNAVMPDPTPQLLRKILGGPVHRVTKPGPSHVTAE